MNKGTARRTAAQQTSAPRRCSADHQIVRRQCCASSDPPAGGGKSSRDETEMTTRSQGNSWMATTGGGNIRNASEIGGQPTFALVSNRRRSLPTSWHLHGESDGWSVTTLVVSAAQHEDLVDSGVDDWGVGAQQRSTWQVAPPRPVTAPKPPRIAQQHHAGVQSAKYAASTTRKTAQPVITSRS
jgi:hypothetical protein